MKKLQDDFCLSFPYDREVKHPSPFGHLTPFLKSSAGHDLELHFEIITNIYRLWQRVFPFPSFWQLPCSAVADIAMWYRDIAYCPLPSYKIPSPSSLTSTSQHLIIAISGLTVSASNHLLGTITPSDSSASPQSYLPLSSLPGRQYPSTATE